MTQVHLAVLHDKEQRAVFLENVEQFDNVGVVQRSQDGGLVFDSFVHMAADFHFFDRIGRGVVDFSVGALPEH